MGRPAYVSKLIIELLTRKHLLSATQIQSEIGGDGGKWNKTSIYRALEKLSRDGAICKQTLTGEDIVYELRDDHHDHLVCESCGRVEKTDCLTSAPPTVSGFVIHHHHTTLFGLCENCSPSSSIVR